MVTWTAFAILAMFTIIYDHRYVASPENVIQLIILGITAALVLRPDQEVIILTFQSEIIIYFCQSH